MRLAFFLSNIYVFDTKVMNLTALLEVWPSGF